MSEISGLVNFREVGGFPSKSGSMTRAGVLFRSDALSALTPEGLTQLAATPIRTIVDLRTPSERAASPDLLPSERPIALLERSILAGSMTGMAASLVSGSTGGQGEQGSQNAPSAPTPEQLAEILSQIPTLGELYVSILDGSADTFVEVARLIARSTDAEPTAVLVHCTAGKDRTGVMTAVMLDAVGVERQAIVADYTATERNLAGPWADNMLKTIASFGIPATPELTTLATGSPASAIETALAWVDEHHGDSAKYLLAAGLTEEELTSLRARMLVS